MNGSNVSSVGVNVWWTCPEVIRDVEAAKSALKAHGFEETAIKTPSRRLEVSRAVYSLQNRQGKENRRVTEKANESDRYIVYGILDREQESTERVGFAQHTTIRVDKESDAVEVEGVLADDVRKAIADYSGKVTDDDIRTFLRGIIRGCWGIAKRPTGGIYFIPSKFAARVKAAQAVLDDLKSGAKLYVEGIINGVEERMNVWESVESEIESRLEETMAAVGRIERSSKCLSDHEAQIQWLGELMGVYQGLLGEEAKYEALAAKIENAVKVVSTKMTDIKESRVQRIAAKKANKVAVAAA